MVNKHDKWVALDKECPPTGVVVLLYNDTLDNYCLGSYTAACKTDTPTASHWRHLPNPPWWCYQCMGIKRGTVILTNSNTAICISCGRDIEREKLYFE